MCLDWKLGCFNALRQSRIGAIHVRVWCFTVMSQSTAGVTLQTWVWDQRIAPVASWFCFTRITCSSGVFQMFCKCPGWSFDVAVHWARCFASICADYLMLQCIELVKSWCDFSHHWVFGV
jgi:hypothetical protein